MENIRVSNSRPRRKRGQGEASIYQLPSGSWRGAISPGPGIPRKYFRGRTAEEVRAKIRKAETMLDGGLALPNEALTVRQCFDRWFESKDATLRRATRINYEGTFRLHILPAVGSFKVAQLTPTIVTRLYSQLRKSGVGDSALVHAHRYLNNMLKWAHRMEIVQRVATSQVDAPRESRSEMRFLDESESRRLLAACEGERLSALFHLLLGTGVRIGEALSLTWGDVNAETQRAHISTSLIARRGGLRVEATKTVSSVRAVPIPNGVLEALSAHRRAMNEESLREGEDWTSPRKPVFVTEMGTHFSPSNFLSRVFKPAVQRAGIEGRLRVHDLRHSYASLALSRGASLAAVSKALGHAKISTTLDMYVHALPSDVGQLSEIMGVVYA